MLADAIMFVVSGNCTLVVSESFEIELQRYDLGAGDFAFIPAWTEHQIVNEDDFDLICVVVHGGSRPVGATLEDWGGDETSDQGWKPRPN